MKIIHRFTGATIYEDGGVTFRDTILAAVSASADLTHADLTRANLTDADLTDADLTDADLTGADLTGADLIRADLTDADLTDADLTGADLTGANLIRADLIRADLTGAKADFLAVLSAVPNDVPALLAALRAGSVNGSVYEGDCACLVGTIANARQVPYDSMPDLRPNASRPAERLFLAIQRGHTPENNPVAAIVVGWIEEWQAERAAQ